MKPLLKAKMLLKDVLSGILGIASEILVVIAVVLVSFLVCMVWWGVF